MHGTPSVDRVIAPPASWLARSRASRLRYFIPDWDDLVDPGYDLCADATSVARLEWSNQVYAHQILPEPAYDGLLVSKVVAEQRKKKREILDRLGVHRFLRVPPDFPVMGDCGAFGYIAEEVPPYSTDEVIDYYTRLGFDRGVSVDHLIFGGDASGARRRYELTLANAEAFLREHRARGLAWEPIGAVQGWDSASYAEAARQVAAMGYRTVGLGGLVRTRTPGVIATLEAVRAKIPDHVGLHLFGIGRLTALPAFLRLGVTSFDSTSYLRQAWMRTETSYVLGDSAYAALRIPPASDGFVRKALERDPALTADEVRRLEGDALRAVRAWAARRISLEGALEALLAYDRHVTADRVDLADLYRRTLAERPWERCSCAICRAVGVEVVVFRGNNRNRRRGFHNTAVFYERLQAVLAGEVAPAAPEADDGGEDAPDPG